MKKIIFMHIGFFILFLMVSCNNSDGELEKQSASESTLKETPVSIDVQEPFQLTLKQANNLAELPLSCMQVEYPNKL